MSEHNMRGLSSLDLFRICDSMTISQAASLLVGEDPNDGQDACSYGELRGAYETAVFAIGRAVMEGEIQLRYESLEEARQAAYQRGEVSPEDETPVSLAAPAGARPAEAYRHTTLIDVTSLRAWLKRRGVTTGFFAEGRQDIPPYLDEGHPRYAPKLALAVSAWLAMESSPLEGVSPKKAIERWARENAARFRLTGEDGLPIGAAIGEVSKVANWQPTGGAPATPTRKRTPT